MPDVAGSPRLPNSRSETASRCLAVRELAAGDVPAIVAIVRSLPDYLTDDVVEQVEIDCADHGGWVIADSGEIAGLAVAKRKSAAGAEILWIAVDRVRHSTPDG